MVELGDEVQDQVTGFIGIAVCRSSYLQGCDRVSLQAATKKNENPSKWVSFDEPQLTILKKKKVKRSGVVISYKKPGGYKQESAEKNY